LRVGECRLGFAQEPQSDFDATAELWERRRLAGQRRRAPLSAAFGRAAGQRPALPGALACQPARAIVLSQSLPVG
jgi:hypothetical protein